MVVRFLPRFLLRLESCEERAHRVEAIGNGCVRGWRRWLSRNMSSYDALLLPKSDFLGAQACLVTLQLRGLHDREDCAEPLVLHDRALVDASVLVERRGGERLATQPLPLQMHPTPPGAPGATA